MSADSPSDAERAQFERRAEQWLQNMQWSMDHLQHRLELTSQLALGVFAGQGALAAFIATRMGVDIRPAWFAYLASVLTLGVAMLLIGYVVAPKTTQSIEPKQYTGLWRAEIDGRGRDRSVPAMFVEELLQARTGGTSAHATLADLINKRYSQMRLVLGLTMIAIALLLVGTVIEVMPDPWPDR